MHHRITFAIKKEIEKYFAANFIISIDYSPWISNIIPIDKPNDEIRCCTDFRYIKKACLKDTFPLPNIDMIVD